MRAAAKFFEKKKYFCSLCGSELEYRRVKDEDDEDFLVIAHSKDAVTSGSPACKLAGKEFAIPDDNILDMNEVEHVG